MQDLGDGEGILKYIRGDRVKRLRIHRGLDQLSLAVYAGTTQGHVSNIERGYVRSVGSEILRGLAQALNTNVEYLVGMTSDDRPLEERVENGELTPEEEQLIKDYRRLKTNLGKAVARNAVKGAVNAERRTETEED